MRWRNMELTTGTSIHDLPCKILVSLPEGYSKTGARTVPQLHSLLLLSRSLVVQEHQPNKIEVSREDMPRSVVRTPFG